MKKNIVLSLLLLLCITACSSSNPSYISQQERKLLLNQLTRKVDEKVGGPYGELVLKLDLLPLTSAPSPCGASAAYTTLSTQKLTREQYQQKIDQMEASLNAITLPPEPLLQEIYSRAEQKTRNLKNIVKQAQLTPKDFYNKNNTASPAIEAAFAGSDYVGGPFVSARKPETGADESDILSSFVVVSNTQALSNKLETLDQLNTVTSALPLSDPLPAARQTSGFSLRKDPINGKIARHEGLDLVGKENATIYSAANGTVAFTGRAGGYGNMVIVDHGFGISTRYAHLNRILVNVGDSLAINQPLGIQGNTGRTTGPHLHYEVRFNNHPRNPAIFLALGQQCTG